MRERKKESKMLWIKCLAGALIMLAVHFISKSPVYFISAIMLSFPGLSMIAYYFMYQEHGAGQVVGTVKFAMFSQIPFSAVSVSASEETYDWSLVVRGVFHLADGGRNSGVSLEALRECCSLKWVSEVPIMRVLQRKGKDYYAAACLYHES